MAGFSMVLTAGNVEQKYNGYNKRGYGKSVTMQTFLV
jgi:hypothetical protein